MKREKNDKDALRPLWVCVTKLEDGRSGGTTKFLCRHNCHKENLIPVHIPV
jgi:hypothetical protein